MLNLIKTLLNINGALAQRLKSEELFEEAIAFYNAREYKKALPLMTESAEMGSAYGALHLGMMFMQGRGVECDWQKAAELYNVAIKSHKEQGHDKVALEAMTNLGLIYGIGGYGLKRDLKNAQTILEQAVKDGDQAAIEPLNMVVKRSGIFGQKEKSRPQIQWKT